MKITVAGHAQKPHTHDAQDKVYYGLKGVGRFSLGDLLLILVLVAPPPTH